MDPRHETHDLQNEDFDAAEDTLSLCDLPMYADAADSEEFSRDLDHQSISSSAFCDEDQQYFEFFSEEWNNIIPNKSDTNIIFCGKLIPYKQPLSDYNHNSKINQHNNRGLLQRNSKSVSTKSDKSVRKVSRLDLPVKSRWYMYTFGLVRYPMNNIELRDMRRRQSRKITGFSCEKNGRSSEKGLWRMIRALGCSGQNSASAVVKAAYGVAPQLAGE